MGKKKKWHQSFILVGEKEGKLLQIILTPSINTIIVGNCVKKSLVFAFVIEYLTIPLNVVYQFNMITFER